MERNLLPWEEGDPRSSTLDRTSERHPRVTTRADLVPSVTPEQNIDCSGGEEEAMGLRRLLVAAPIAVLTMAACAGPKGDDLTAALEGEGVVEGGVADIEINPDRTELCWDIRGLVGTVNDVTAMHIHAGAVGDVGPVVVEFISGNRGCWVVSPGGITEAALRSIAAEPANFYVDVHSDRHPDGAVRGQLELQEGGA